jgi:hypothetical protein
MINNRAIGTSVLIASILDSLYSGDILEMAEETVRLEGFSESLRGTKSYCVSSDPKFAQNFLKGRVAALDAEVAHRGRKVLVFQGSYVPPRWLLQMGWDAVFHVRDVQDLKLALTYIQHTSRPTRVVWTGGDPAISVLNALGRMDGITLIALGEKAPQHSDWQMIFWEPDVAIEIVEATLLGRMGQLGAAGLRSILKELRASSVGLVWSSVGETDTRGGLYWYDPAEGVDLATHIDPHEAAAVLTEVAAFLTR